MKMATNKKTVKSMDIQKPGEATPDSSSRPIITKRPMLQDPMLKEASDSTESESEPQEQKSMASSTKTIEPPKDSEPNLASIVTATETSETGESTEDEEQPAASIDSIDPKSTAASSESAVVDAVVNSGNGSNLSNEQKTDQADEKRKQAVQELIDSKKYVVPIGQVTRARHNRQVLWLFIFILIVLVGYAVVDLGLVSLPFELPIDLIK